MLNIINSFGAQSSLKLAEQEYQIFRLDAVPNSARLPYALKILLENLLRHENGHTVTRQDLEFLRDWDPKAKLIREIQYHPTRVIMQDFTGVPSLVDLAAMRDAVNKLGGDPSKINPLQPVDLVIDHSIQADFFGCEDALMRNVELEFARNRERYEFLKWGQQAFQGLRVIPPGTGIVHQVNLEYLAQVVWLEPEFEPKLLSFDTCVGTDSHTTMINGIGVLGWGVGGIEAEASLLGQPISMLIPPVVGCRLTGILREGVTATDLVLTLVERLRKHGVVGKFVEFFGPALSNLPVGERTTIANMAPEYGATCGIFPIDALTLEYLRLTGRPTDQLERIEAYCRAQGVWYTPDSSLTEDTKYSELLEFDLSTVVPTVAGPRRPQDRIPLTDLAQQIPQAIATFKPEFLNSQPKIIKIIINNQEFSLSDGVIALAAITSCTNTSNPSVLIAAGLLAQKARARGLNVAPWVKTIFGPGSLAVTRYLDRAGLLSSLQELGFYPVGYGCTACIGNSGPLLTQLSQAIAEFNLCTVAVLSGNRNFEGRIHSEVRLNYLASPPLVVAYAIAGKIDLDLTQQPLGYDSQNTSVYLKDIWPSNQEINQIINRFLIQEDFLQAYDNLKTKDQRWQELTAPTGHTYHWPLDSTYLRCPPYFDGMKHQPDSIQMLRGARCLAWLGDSVTTDHISPAGSIQAKSPAGQYLLSQDVKTQDFNNLGSRRGNHEVMMRATFAHPRLRNLLAPEHTGGMTRHQPSQELLSIYSAAMRYQQENIPVIIIAGREYGTGSSRDWAAKGPYLLGVRAVLAESYERIHRSNLVGMGILPLQFKTGETADTWGLLGTEVFELGYEGFAEDEAPELELRVIATDGMCKNFAVLVRIDTPNEWEYYRHGGILHYVLRRLI